MLDTVLSIIGDYTTLEISDTALFVVTVYVFIFSMDWIFNLLSMAIATITKRR